MENEMNLDVRRLVDVLLRRRRLIISVALGVTLLAALFAWLSPTPYQAVAGVAVIKVKTSIEFDPRFKTASEDTLGSGYVQAMGAEARRESLAALVANGSVASQVIDEMGDQLRPAERNPGALLQKVDAKLVKGSDLIQISVTDADPEHAAAIANAWAQAYERHVNNLYGGGTPAQYVESIQSELERAHRQYEEAQTAVETFVEQNQSDALARQIAEKQHIVDSLQNAKQAAITSIVDGEVEIRKTIIDAYFDAQTQNRLLAFNKEQESRRAIVTELIDAETNARLTAFRKDREARVEQFTQYVDADKQAKWAVFDQQLQSRLQSLANAYETKLKLERLLADVKALQRQAAQAGEAGVATNSLAILLLKAQVYASSAELPGQLQLQWDGMGGLGTNSVSQLADLQALAGTLESRLSESEDTIDRLSRQVFDNQGYDLLVAGRTEDDPLYAAMRQLAAITPTVSGNDEFSQAILAKYDELFGVGALGEMSLVLSPTTPLLMAIQEQYPQLFEVSDLAQLGGSAFADSSLAATGLQQVNEMLRLDDLESLPSYSAATESLSQTLGQLQQEINQMQAELERQRATQQDLTQVRDLASETYLTLARKQSEADIAGAVTGSEVRFAAPAVPPARRVSSPLLGIIMSGCAGLLLGVLVVLSIEYLWRGQVTRRLVGRPGAWWNRAWNWLVTEDAGLPDLDKA